MKLQSIAQNPQYSNFTGKHVKPKEIARMSIEEVLNPHELSLSAKTLVKKSHQLMEETWTRIKKKEIKMETPSYTKEFNSKKVTLSPLYNGYDRNIVLNIKEEKNNYRILVDKTANNFVYEKSVNTDFGSATIYSYNSKISPKSETTTKLVSELLEEYLPKFTKHLSDRL